MGYEAVTPCRWWTGKVSLKSENNPGRPDQRRSELSGLPKATKSGRLTSNLSKRPYSPSRSLRYEDCSYPRVMPVGKSNLVY